MHSFNQGRNFIQKPHASSCTSKAVLKKKENEYFTFFHQPANNQNITCKFLQMRKKSHTQKTPAYLFFHLTGARKHQQANSCLFHFVSITIRIVVNKSPNLSRLHLHMKIVPARKQSLIQGCKCTFSPKSKRVPTVS